MSERITNIGWQWALIVTAILGIAGCKESGHGYPEKTFRLFAFESQRLYWLDNDRLFVTGFAPDDNIRDENGRHKKGIYILDTKNNTHFRYANIEEGSRFCFHNGFITYKKQGRRKNHDIAEVNVEGFFGLEKELPSGRTTSVKPGDRTNYTDCPSVVRHERLRQEHIELERKNFPVRAKFLKAEHGYIYAGHCQEKYCAGSISSGSKSSDRKVLLYRPGSIEPTEIDILAKELGPGSYIRYSNHLNKYIIVPATRRDTILGHSYSMDGSYPYGVYLLSQTGVLEKILIPDGPWLRPQDAELTVAGLFFAGGRGARTGDGGFLIKYTGEFLHIFKNNPTSVGVSPNGCKLAYQVGFKTESFNDKGVRVIDFCNSY